MYRHLTFPHFKTLDAVDLSADSDGLHVDTGQFKPVEQRVVREQRFCPVCETDTAEDEHHFVFDCPNTVQSGKGLLPFSGDQPLPCLLSSLYMTTRSLPSFCMNVLHTGLCY